MGRDQQKTQSSAAASGLAAVGAVVATAANFLIAFLVSKDSASFAGVFFVATAIVAIAGNTSCLGTMTGMVYFMPQILQRPSASPRRLLLLAVWPVTALALALAIVLGITAHGLAAVVTDGDGAELTAMLRIMTATVPFWALTVTLLGAARGLGTVTPTVGVNQVLRPGLQIILLGTVFALDATPPAWQVAVAWAVPIIVGFVVSVAAVYRLGGFVDNGSSGSIERAEFWQYTRPRSISTALQIALERLDVILVSAFIGEAAAGVYGALTRFISAGNFLIFSIGQAVSAHLRRSISGAKWSEAQQLLQNATGWMVLVAWPYFFVVAFHHVPLARLMSPDYVADSGILAILALAMLVSAAAGPIDLTLLMLGRSKESLIGVSAAIVIDLVLLAALTPSLGLRGAAIAWAVSVVSQNLISTVFVHRQTRLLTPVSGAQRHRVRSGLHAYGRPALTAGLLAIVAVVPVSFATDRQQFSDVVVTGLVSALVLGLGGLLLHRELGLDEQLPSGLLSRLPRG